jgi:hypothetical protein
METISRQFSRNIGILSIEHQSIISKSRIAIFGCGMGSVIAEHAARIGFKNITLIDGDIVDETNLNRQSYIYSDIGNNKVNSIAKRLKDINPDINLVLFPKFASIGDIKILVDEVDLIIDTIDISAIDIIVALHREARKQYKSVFFPINLGWGSGLLVFNNNSATIEDMLGVSNNADIESLEKMYLDKSIFDRWVNMCAPNMPEYLIKLLGGFLEKVETSGWCPVPQIDIATSLSSILVITAVIKTLLGIKIKSAPEMITSDAWLTVE